MATPGPVSFARGLVILVAAVVTGGVVGAMAGIYAAHWWPPDTARNIALAVATTVTGATHARLVHHQPLSTVVPAAAVSVPIVYFAMRLVHLLVAY